MQIRLDHTTVDWVDWEKPYGGMIAVSVLSDPERVRIKPKMCKKKITTYWCYSPGGSDRYKIYTITVAENQILNMEKSLVLLSETKTFEVPCD